MKRILWVTNIILPEASKLLGEKIVPFGGWMDLASTFVSEADGLKLLVASPYNGSRVEYIKGEKIDYIFFPAIYKFNRKVDQSIINDIVDKSNLDFIHIFGTEMPHSYYFFNAAKSRSIPTGINIQGLVSIISEQYYFNMPIHEITVPTLKSILSKNSIKKQRKRFERNGKYEKIMIKNSNFVFGRTIWDKAFFEQTNPSGQYIKWNETLRKSFYNHEWNFDIMKKHSIFMSQGHYPLKGLHQAIKAVSILKEKYKDIKLRVAGPNILNERKLGIPFISQYGRYIKRLINKYGLSNNIEFIGLKNEQEILEEYLNCNVFIVPSSIENGSNSLGEALILGVPTIAAHVGGMVDYIVHSKNGYLYNPNEYNILAYYIDTVFSLPKNETQKVSSLGRVTSSAAYDKELNNKVILDFYNNKIIKK